MNLAQILGAVRKVSRAVDALDASAEESRLAGRALLNALHVVGFPLARALPLWQRFGLADPVALATGLRRDPEIRRWVWAWSGEAGPLPIPKPRKVPRAAAR